MKAFDLEAHIFDHAYILHRGENIIHGKMKHFKCSIDTSYFVINGYKTQEKIDEVMVRIFNNVKDKKFTVHENNGTFTNKNGEKRQKTRQRTIRFDNLSMAYHSEHFDRSKYVNPHFHFLIYEKSRVGIGYSYLKGALEDEATKHNLKFHFMESKQNNGLTQREEMTVNTLSWTLQQGERDRILYYLYDTEKLTRTLDILVIHYSNTLNISYFTKIMKSLHQRLYELNMDFIYQGINLKNEIFFFLYDAEKELIERLQKLQHVKLDLQYVLDREILKYAHGFGSEAIEVICDHFHISSISPQQLTITNDNLTVEPRKKKENHFRNLVINDIQAAIRQAHSENYIKELLLNSGAYSKVVTKTQKGNDGKRKKIGFKLTTQKNAQVYVHFYELGMDFKQIIMTLMVNTKKKRRLNEFQSQIGDYKKKQRIDEEKETTAKMTLFQLKPKLLLSIHIINKKPTKSSILPEKFAEKYQIDRSELYDITTLKSNDTTFVDYGDRISLTKNPQYSLKNIISDMLDLAVIKGWNLREVEINGDDNFRLEAKSQIKMRHKLPVNLQKKSNKIKP